MCRELLECVVEAGGTLEVLRGFLVVVVPRPRVQLKAYRHEQNA